MPLELQALRALGRNAGLAALGVTTAAPFSEARVTLERRRGEGLHGGMQFTYRNPARSTDPSRTLGSARRLLVGAYAFGHGSSAQPAGDASGPAAGEHCGRPGGFQARVAAYAAQDHYAGLRAALEVVAERIRSEGFSAVVIADENNLVDRAAAHRAGLGWWGKSSNILVPGLGSMVVLGSVLTDAEIELPTGGRPLADGCGACSACMSGCPTDAIVEPGVVDANRCLAWLLQAEGPFPAEYREALGDRIYGCDECQDVCPPNRARAARASAGPHALAGVQGHVAVGALDMEQGKKPPSPAGSPSEEDERGLSCGSGPATAVGDRVDVIAMLDLDDETLMARFGRWYIARRDPAYLRRNALVVLANIGRGDDPEVRRVLGEALAHRNPLVRSHAVWAARQLDLQQLSAALHADPDPGVQLELARV